MSIDQAVKTPTAPTAPTASAPAGSAGSPLVTVRGLSKRYGEATVFEQVDFSIAAGEFVCVIGHSGCGKSTILNVLAGLEPASAGEVVMAGREVAGPGLDRGVVFQGHALMPWLTVRQNIAFAVRSRWPGWTRAQVTEQVERYVELVGLRAALEKTPSQLSGGMKQRVGIARAFAIEPRMLLLDEPFGALDALTRGTIQDELMRICARTRQTVFMITHDVDEAMLLSDRILLMSNGPRAGIAEVVHNTLSTPRDRRTLHHDPRYYALRNHLIDFLVSRSATLSDGRSPRPPLEVRPGLDITADPVAAPDSPLIASIPTAIASPIPTSQEYT